MSGGIFLFGEFLVEVGIEDGVDLGTHGGGFFDLVQSRETVREYTSAGQGRDSQLALHGIHVG